MKDVTIYADGACSGNPGPGGYAAILKFGNLRKEISGFESRTTNNRMELRAIIEGIAPLKEPCNILVRTDSQTACNALENLDEMPSKGWKTKAGARRANCDLLERMLKIKKDGMHVIRVEHVKGHNGDPDNERCDALATGEIRSHTR